MPKSLTELANFYGTDKGTIGPSTTWTAHNYTDVYEAYLERYKSRPINLLEIGLGVTGERWDARIVHGRNTGGASLRMWYDYFPNAQIYGIDVNRCTYLDNDRCKTYVVNQGSIDELETFVKALGNMEFDVIIDDGSHRPDHQQISFAYLFKTLKSGGIYFIEDLSANGMGDGASGRCSSANIMNTRSVLKNFAHDDKFLEPNALGDKTYLEQHIDYIRFHCPRVGVRFVLKRSFRHPVKKVIYYRSAEESLCMIRKK